MHEASDVPPGTEEQWAALLQWCKLGEGLAALGPHRLAIAARPPWLPPAAGPA